MRRFAVALVLAWSSVLPAPAGARAAKVPKELCLEWTAAADDTDTIILDFVLRPEGSFTTEHATSGRTKYKLYSLHGLAGRGALPDGPFPGISGNAFKSQTSTNVLVNILLISNEGTFTFRVVYPLAPGPNAMTRIAPDGTVTAGFFTRLDCSGVTVGN
jgi:hypothetical protein